MGNGLEHLAAWRGRDPLTIWEAASLIAETDPNYVFPAWKDRTGDDRERRAAIDSWRDRLWNAAQGQGEGPQLVATIKTEDTQRHVGGGNFVTNFNYAPPRIAIKKTPSAALSTARVEDLRTWLEAIGQRPAFFFTDEQGRALDGRAMRGHENESDLLRVLIRASARFWEGADRQEKDTHPTNAEVAKWLVGNGFTPSLAKHAASIIRPDWAATGRSTKK